MRDAISILDRCIAEGNEEITELKVRELAGIPEFEYLTRMIDALVSRDIDAVLDCSGTIISEGKDLNVFLWELIKTVRDLLVLATCKECDKYKEDELEKLKQIILKTDKAKLINLIEELSILSNSMKWATEQDVIFETGLIKFCSTPSEIVSNISSGNENKRKETSDLKLKVLTKLKENGKILLHTKLEATTIEICDEDGLVHITFENPIDAFSRLTLLKEESKQAIKEAVISSLGREVGVKFVNLKGKEE